MKRVGALLGAVAMVVAALAVRGTFTDDDDTTTATSGGATGGIVCPVEFRDLCDGLDDVTLEAAGDTADRLITDADPGDVVWIVPSAWADLVVAERARLGGDEAFSVDDGAIASSAVVLAVWDDRAEQLRSDCGELDWRCLAERSGTSLVAGDRVRTGSPPVDSATGLVVAGAQSGSLLGTPDFAANDFVGDFDSLAARLASGQRDDPLAAMRSRGPGQITATGVVAADATNLESSLGTITAVDGTPFEVRADVVALTAGGGLDDDRRDRLRDAFLEAGWDPPADGPDGLPAGGVLAAIRTLWEQNR